MTYKVLTRADMSQLQVGDTLHAQIDACGRVFVNEARIVGRWPLERSKPWDALVVDVGGTNIRFDRSNTCTTVNFGPKTHLVYER